jgi:hypothetical protein
MLRNRLVRFLAGPPRRHRECLDYLVGGSAPSPAAVLSDLLSGSGQYETLDWVGSIPKGVAQTGPLSKVQVVGLEKRSAKAPDSRAFLRLLRPADRTVDDFVDQLSSKINKVVF